MPEARPDPSQRALLRLAAVGTAAGAFSGLFGVGGGTVIVPLLILWLGYGGRLATGTSLAAIVLIAVLAAALQGAYGNVELEQGLLLSIPAVAGIVAGTALQQRLPQRAVSLLFALILVIVALELILS
ncbi:MAG: sulfite exporter TauE/SafE family protein [Solirubrobacterales bacterium]